jgi:hypothetical protein
MECPSQLSKSKPFSYDSKSTRNSQVKPSETVGTAASPAHADDQPKKRPRWTTAAALRLLILSKHRGTKALVSNQTTLNNPWRAGGLASDSCVGFRSAQWGILSYYRSRSVAVPDSGPSAPDHKAESHRLDLCFSIMPERKITQGRA